METKINKFDYFGRGITRVNDKVIFVNRALPDEIVDIEITKEKKNYDEANVKEVIKSSTSRIESICPFYDKCGGCTFMHATYEEEKEFKINKAIILLGRCDSFYETKNLNYRNKVLLHVNNGKLGLYEENSNTLVNIDYCYLLNDKINKVIKDLQEVNLSRVNTIVIKTNQDKVLLSISGEIDNNSNLSNIDTVICNGKVLKGNGYLEEIIDGKTFKITPEAFFQVNLEGLNNINKIIKEFLKDKVIENVLDLYSGTSLWGILISNSVKSVTGVEINKEACDNALYNISKNNVNNVQVINGDVKDYIDCFKNIDLVIVDPPRSGLDKKTREYLKVINSKYIIYISCDMISLKRDLEELNDVYDIKEVNLVDMFKRTYHCESIVILERGN